MAKQELLTALEENNTADFISLLQRHGKKRSNVDLQEVLSEFSRTQHEFLWSCLYAWTNEQLTRMVVIETPAEVAGEVADTHSLDSEQTVPMDAEEAVQKEPYNEKLMAAILDLAYIYISSLEGQENFIPDKLLEVVVLLHGMVMVFEGAVQNGIVALCEMWWKQQLDEREHVIINILPIMLDAASGKNGRRKEVQSLWALRDALQLIPLSDPECHLLVEKLIACSTNTLFITCEEGIKWLSELFSRESLIIPMHRGIKTVLPSCTRAQSSKYAEVYFRSWKNSQGTVKQMLEEECIQDLMYAAVHVDPMAGRLSANLHHFLHHFHRHKKHHTVATMVYTLYDPFMWRSLKAANGFVRMNATGLLCDAFPLLDNTMSQEEREGLLEKQYHTMITLLVDPCHLVRITAIKGVTKILASYWLMIPSNIIKTVFQKLLSDLLYDASSAEVRTQVLKGIILMLDSNDAVPFLKEVLPRIGDAFDDINGNVRSTFVKILLKVKSLKIIRYWDIVPMNHILHRLEEDTPVMCKLITQLLLNTFHPIQREDQELLHRTLALLEENRAAARRFYQYTSRKLDLQSNVHFMLLILRCLRNHLLNQQAQVGQQESDHENSNTSLEERTNPSVGSQKNLKLGLGVAPDNKENRVPSQRKAVSAAAKESDERKDVSDDEQNADDDSASPLDNPAVIGGLFDTIVIIWTTNAHRLAQPENEKYIEAIRTRVSKSMPLFFKAFKENDEVSQTLLYLSSFLPKALVPTIVSHCMSRLRGLQQDQDKEESYVTYVNALCNWNRVDDILELATEWLNEGFSAGVTTSSKERRKSRKGVRFQEALTPQPLLALRLVGHILQHPLNKLAALGRNRHLLVQMSENMAEVKGLLGDRLNQTEELSALCSDRFLCECWAQYLSLVAVLHNPPRISEEACEKKRGARCDKEIPVDDVYDGTATVVTCIDWCRRVLIPTLGEEQSGKRKIRAGEDAPVLAVSALSDLVTCITNLLTVGAGGPSFAYKACGFAEELLKTDASDKFWQKSLVLAQEAYEFLEVYGTPGDDLEEFGGVSPEQLTNTCLSSISDFCKQQEKLPQDGDLVNILALVLTSFGDSSNSCVMKYLVSSVIDHLSWHIDKVKGVDTDVNSVKEVGGFVALTVGVCQSRAKLSAAFMTSFMKLNSSVQDITSLLASAYLLKILIRDSGKISPSSLKQAVAGLDSVMSRIVFPTCLEEENGDKKPTFGLYERYTAASRDIIQDMKDMLGVI
ncbi:condensin-2 complex subunit G2-like isoform X1 [Penaeus monodon]|uniref:condensin-2 complex subunit G2-like isoform X1 n=1 Tax=Penaeus monodon TaxID=6687 RepID=UPI0018A79585|nr:condensin-2 complex subunit G2-like isoform X1 [Penaeus monodon]XP_037804390.1 condensin-2 complex subunit G2-like isoform X1 [Penaeus monodon]XP_037804469.1 condensin-2 complex subunit G2-like isoform X1 [Penaeus monodon]